jgi:hypothetical protein
MGRKKKGASPFEKVFLVGEKRQSLVTYCKNDLPREATYVVQEFTPVGGFLREIPTHIRETTLFLYIYPSLTEATF